ncbi:integrator complex subunit 1 [Zootermopsis nevadensis]|uniref:integrator complex subunit 1 n=1 Tax=Zootermopsis nevadensis TaxID=136037 RepID=UPI000B8E7D0E|nr:integrator complex subunit 1 [Zootermopsis nevadensis]
MERGKASQGRGAKTKTQQYPADLFALGSKSSRMEGGEAKRVGVVHGKPGASHSFSSADRKREVVGGPLPPIPAKKTKIGTSSILGRVTGSGSSGGAEAWEMVAVDCEPAELVPAVLEACNLDEGDKEIGLLCGAIRTLRSQRWKPDSVSYLGLLYLAKLRPSLFAGDCVMHALCSLLRRDTSHNFKSKGNPLVPVLAANLLLRGFQDRRTWPDVFIKLYVEDSLGDRVWVDHEDCGGFVSNLLTAVNSRIPPRSLLQPDLPGLPGSRGESCPSPCTVVIDDDGAEGSVGSGETGLPTDIKEKMDIPVVPRYVGAQDAVEQIIMDAVREQLNRRQSPENITRNFLRLLSASCGLVEVRVTTAPRLEIWLQNPKLMRPAQELLMSVCLNCSTHTQKDIEVISHLVKIRLKTKALINLYLSCIRELITAHPDNLATVLKHTIYNELSTARNPNNMAMISVMFQSAPDSAATFLAEIFQDLLMNREDYLRPIRALLREIVRVLRHDINISGLCRGLMLDRKDSAPQFRDFEFKERMFVSITDLITLCSLLAVSPSVREAAALLARGDKREIAVLHNFQLLVAKIERDAVWWLHETVPRMYRPSAAEFVHALHKVLFMEHPEQYYNRDMWPPENDRPLMFRLASDVPVLQNTLIRIFVIGLSKDHPLAPPDTLELTDQLLKRAAAQSSESLPMLQADKLDIIDLVFNLSAYHHPDNINLPPGYCPPQLAIANLYWKGWIMLLILSAHNPTTFGSVAWEKYPTLRTLMEMCITNHFTYPPPTIAMGEQVEETKAKELQIAALEKQQILEFESYLAAASTKQTITEQTSLLLTQLITMDPTGPPRKPPQAVLEQLQSLNSTHRMGHLLCRSRHPDFLLDIIQRQGASQSMPWLADLVESSEGALRLLQPEKQQKHQQLLQHLQMVLTDAKQDPQAPCEVLEYFLRRLSSPQTGSRAQAIKGLKLVLSSVSMEEEAMEIDSQQDPNGDNSWLLRQLPQLPHFLDVRPQVVQALRQACQVENDPALVSSYIYFLALHTTHDSLPDLADLVLDMAQLIVERSSIVAAILPAPDQEVPGALITLNALMLMFCSYLQKAREPRREAYTWSESQDQILVTWSTGEESTMHILVVHAMIILLNYGPGLDLNLFESLLETWFPLGKETPKAYLVDTSEEALLIPDWLKLRMIRSNVDRLVDAALTDLEPPQLVLFIQSFGIPVKSMSKLLHTLDEAVTADPLSVGEAVLDKSYMAQLVEVQHHRGATGGQMLVRVVQLEQPKLPDYSRLCPTTPRPTLPVAALSNKDRTKVEHQMDAKQVASILLQIFGSVTVEPEWSKVEKQQAFRTLQKTLAVELQQLVGEKKILVSTIAFFDEVLNSPRSTRFVSSLLHTPQLACPLLRLMTTTAAKASNSHNVVQSLVGICQGIMRTVRDTKSPVVAIIKHFLCKHTLKREQKSQVVQLSSTEDPFQVLQQSPILKLERNGQLLLDEGLKLHHTEKLVEAMGRLLLQDTTGSSTQIDNMASSESRLARPERTGLLIDWLASVEPELIGSCTSLQMQLLFSKSPNNQIAASKLGSPATQSCRPYLLTLLTHRASWTTLHHCLQNLLDGGDQKYDPAAVLDFLWALTCNPKLWQGREKFTPKHHSPEDILRLTSAQTLALVGYIVEEAVITDAEGESLSRQNASDKMESRLPLLLQCTNDGQEMAAVAKYLVDIMSGKTGLRSDVANHLLLKLYFRIPGVIQHLTDVELDKFLAGACVTEWSSSVLDGMSHTLFTALTATSQNKDWTRRSQEYELLARKMASVHPVLVLRQLPMLAASLRGRVHLDFSVFRSRNHLNLFQQVVGILELLQPHIFLPAYSEGLEDTFHSYFALFKYHGHMKDLTSLLNRFISLLQGFISYDAQRALKYLQKHAHILNDLQMYHQNLPSLRALLSGISLPKTDDEGDEVIVAVAAPPITADPSPAWTPRLASLNKMQGDDVYTALQELDHLSSRKPSVLDAFCEPISELLLSPTSNIRVLAHVLLTRHLRHNPAAATAGTGLAAFLRCLESDQADILNTALERLSEIVLCAQEHALPLLQKVFNLGMCSNVNTVPHISKTIALLNVQTGC